MGTVASRTMELQNLAKPSTSNRSRSPVTHRRENSRAGFGRRNGPRFGKPATRSSKPDEEINVDPKHSFLGLNSHRRNHMEEHALVDGRAKWERTAGLHGQLQPSGLGARVQYEATSPWGVLPKGESRRNSQSGHNKQEMGTLGDSGIKSQLSNIAPVSPLPNSLYHGTRRMGIKQDESLKTSPQKSRRHIATDQRKALTSCDWLSVETTSTLRRQSVKDLYYHYGIQRPAGLVSSENTVFHPEEAPRPFSKYRICHVCSWATAPDIIKCRCGHSLCRECENSSPEAITTSDGSADCIANVPRCEGKHLQKAKSMTEFPDSEIPKPPYEEQQKPNPKLKRQSTQVELHHQETSKKHRSRSREEPDGIPGTFPVLRLEEATPRYGSWETPLRNAKLPNSSRVYQQTTIASDAQTPVRGPPPSPMTDALLSTSASNILAIKMRVSELDTQDLHHGQHHRQEGCYHRSPHSNSSSKDDRRSGDDNCDSSGCRATHQGYRPYRHSITCTRKRRRYAEETDSGYIAGASHLEELEVSQQKTDPNPRSGSRVHGHHMPSKQRLSQSQNESDSPRGKIGVYEDGQSTHQKSYEDHEASFQSKANRPEGLQHSQEQFYPKEHRRISSYKTAASLPDNFQSYDLPGKEDDKQSNLNTFNTSCECKQRVNEYQIQECGAGYRQVHSHVYNEHAQARPYIAPGNATVVAASHGSIIISLEPPLKTLLELASFDPVEQSMTTVSTPKPHMEMKSPDWLTDDTAVPSLNTAKQEILIVQNNQSRLDGRKIWSGKARQENLESPIALPSGSTRKVYEPRSGRSIHTDVVPQDSQNTVTAAPSIAAEDDHPEHCASSHADLTADTVQSVSIQASGDLSPRKFKPASRRLSAFFKLQEQNIVSLLNKRLQEHQDGLKRTERMSNDQVNALVQSLSLDQEQDHEVDRKRNEVELESTANDPAKKCEHDLLNSLLQLRERGDKVKGFGTTGQEGGQNSSSELAHMLEEREEEHDCAWKRIAMGDKNGIAQKPNMSGAEDTTTIEKASDIGINGITIVIHLEGREDVVIKADLGQGI